MGRWGISWPVPWLVFAIVDRGFNHCQPYIFQEVQGRVMELILLQHLGEMEEDMVAAPVVLEVINDNLFVIPVFYILSFTFFYIERAPLLVLEIINDQINLIHYCCGAFNKANFRW